MTPERLLAHYDRIADAPDAIARLRRFVLDLAVRGKLVAQDAADEPASSLLNEIGREVAGRVKSGALRRRAPPIALDTKDMGNVLPSGWVNVSLGSIIHLVSGQHLQTDEYSDQPSSGPPYITGPSDFTPAGLAISRYALVRKAIAQHGDLLLTVKGSGVGKTAICDLPEVAISRQLMALTVIGWDRDFLSLVTHLLADKLKAEVRSLIPGISREDVEGFVVALPPLAEQRRIVAKVDELMALCDRLEAGRVAREAARDRLAAASLARLNTPDPDPATFTGDARFALNTLSAVTTRPDQIKALRQTILSLAVRGGLSERRFGSFKAEKLGSVATLQNGYAFKSEWFVADGIRLLRNANVGHGILRWDEVVYLSDERSAEFERFRLAKGDIVLSLDRPFIVTGTKVARVCEIDLPALLLQRVGRFQFDQCKITPDYLFLWLHSPHFTGQVDPGRSNGVPHISSKQVEATDIVLPPVAEQLRIVAKVDTLMALCDRLEAALTTGDETRRRLLDALLQEALASPEADLDSAA